MNRIVKRTAVSLFIVTLSLLEINCGGGSNSWKMATPAGKPAPEPEVATNQEPEAKPEVKPAEVKPETKPEVSKPAEVKPVVEGPKESPWGIASSASSTGTIDKWFPMMSAAGITSTRMGQEWSGMEREKGKMDFTGMDRILAAAQANHIEVSTLFFGSPKWTGAGWHGFAMKNLDDWENYANAMVSRYKDRIHYWEVWNEGNAGFNDGHNTAEDYARLVSAAYEGAKKADPNAQVGISVASFDAPYIGVMAQAMAKDGKPGQFDFICIHPYETFGAIGDPDGEIHFLWMKKVLQDELKATAPDKVNVPVWITEIGRPINRDTNESGVSIGGVTTPNDAGHAVVKAYIMSIAEGIARVCWFEGEDPEREQKGYGLLDVKGNPRPSYTAMKTMTTLLGETPTYDGWLALGADGRDYGFVFQGEKGPVLALWAPARLTDSITFSGDVQVTDPLTGMPKDLKAGQALALTNDPVLIIGLPKELVSQAEANKAKYFPWGGDYSAASTVSIEWGKDGVKNNGIFQNDPEATPIHTFEDGTAGITVKGDISHPVCLRVHPSFANVNTREYYIRASFRRITPTGNVGMNFRYEVADSHAQGPMRGSGGWFSLPKEEGWQTHEWHVTDASFAKMWGYDISFNPEQSVPFALGKVEVSTQPFSK